LSAPATTVRSIAICAVVCLGTALAASGSPLSQDPQGAEETFSQAEAALSAGDVEAALQMWDSILRQYPRSRFPDLMWRAAAATRAGEIEVRLGRADAAAARFVAVLDGEEPSIWTERARLGLATTLIWRDEWPAAFALLQSIVSAAETDRPGSDPVAARFAGELLSLGHRLWIRPSAGQQPWSRAGRWAAAGSLDKPIGVAAGRTTDVTVIDEGLQRVLLVGGDGTPATFPVADAVRSWRSPAGRDYVAAKGAVTAPLLAESFQFSVPDGSRQRPLGDIRAGASGGAGEWILLDGRMKQVLLFDSGGGYQGFLDLGPDGEPVDVARGPRGRIFVVEKKNREVLVFTPDGSLESGFRVDGWREPYAVAVDAAGFIYVLDRGTKRITVFDGYGAMRWTLGPTLPGGVELDDPRDIAVDASGRVLVADRGLSSIIVIE